MCPVFMTSKEYFPQRLRSARKMSGLTLDALAERIGKRVTKQALNKYEQGMSYPDPGLFQPLCMALEVSPDYFTRRKRVELEHYQFNKLGRLQKREQAMALEKTRDALERYLELEELLGLEIVFDRDIPGIPFEVHTQEDAERAADAVRVHFELGTAPVFNAVELLEERGVKVIELELEESFQGMSGYAGEGAPVIVLNKGADSRMDQKRFQAFSELGHLLLNVKPESAREAGRLFEAFAGALLLPGAKVVELFGRHRSALIWSELVIIKELFGIPIRVILYRAKMHGIITQYDYATKMAELSRFYGRKEEPGRYFGVEKPVRFRRLLLRAIAEEVISISKAAALEGKTVAEFREELRKGNEGDGN